MVLDDLCKKLVEYGLVDVEKFNPNFTERIMREGGGVKVIQNQDADITANIRISARGLEKCIQQYGPEKVEAFFYLQELANHARMLFYRGVNQDPNKGKDENRKTERRGFTEHERESIRERVIDLNPGFYKSIDIGSPLGIKGKSIGTFLAHLDDAEREKLKIKYDSEKKGWEKY